MKKLNITKEAFNKSKYFQHKYGKLEFVSESGKVYKTDKGQLIKFVNESLQGDLLNCEPSMKVSELIAKLQDILDNEKDWELKFLLGGDRYSETYTLMAGNNELVKCSYEHEEPSW